LTELVEEYARKAQEQLDLAAAATDPAKKAGHLDRAAHYATLRERAVRASSPDMPE
jgi:hypothetical protein